MQNKHVMVLALSSFLALILYHRFFPIEPQSTITTPMDEECPKKENGTDYDINPRKFKLLMPAQITPSPLPVGSSGYVRLQSGTSLSAHGSRRTPLSFWFTDKIIPPESLTEVYVSLAGNHAFFNEALVPGGAVMPGIGTGDNGAPTIIGFCKFNRINDNNAMFFIWYKGGRFKEQDVGFNVLIKDLSILEAPIIHIVDPKIHDRGM